MLHVDKQADRVFGTAHMSPSQVTLSIKGLMSSCQVTLSSKGLMSPCQVTLSNKGSYCTMSPV